MITVSSLEFRSKQKDYLDKEAFFVRIKRAIVVKEGKTYTMKSGESLRDFIYRMEREGNV